MTSPRGSCWMTSKTGDDAGRYRRATNRRLCRSELLSQLVSRSAQRSSGTLLGDLAVEHNRPAIHENIFNPRRVTERILVRSNVLNRRGVEERNISHHS